MVQFLTAIDGNRGCEILGTSSSDPVHAGACCWGHEQATKYKPVEKLVITNILMSSISLVYMYVE